MKPSTRRRNFIITEKYNKILDALKTEDQNYSDLIREALDLLAAKRGYVYSKVKED